MSAYVMFYYEKGNNSLATVFTMKSVIWRIAHHAKKDVRSISIFRMHDFPKVRSNIYTAICFSFLLLAFHSQ